MATFVELHACFDKCEKIRPAGSEEALFAEVSLSVPILVRTEQIVGIAPVLNGACVNLRDKQECLRVVESPADILAKIDARDVPEGAAHLAIALVIGAGLVVLAQRIDEYVRPRIGGARRRAPPADADGLEQATGIAAAGEVRWRGTGNGHRLPQ